MNRKTVRCRGRTYPVIGELRLGRRHYQVVKELGRGEMLQAIDPYASPEGELRAIRIVPRSARSEQIVGVLKRVAEHHSNLPAILEYHPVRDQIYLVLPWVRGRDLEAYLAGVRERRDPRISVGESFRLVRGLAHGLSQLHQKKNIVHGDLKPANLILCWEPSRLVLIDFGSAWLVERTARRDPGDGGGRSDPYAAPEQLLTGGTGSGGQPSGPSLVDFRSDHFSLSVIFYEMLTLKIPYGGLGGHAALPDYRPKAEKAYVPPSRESPGRESLPPGIWVKIDRLVTRGLSLDPRRRFEGRRDWLGAFDEIYADLKRPSLLSPFSRGLLRVIDGFQGLWPFPKKPKGPAVPG